MKHTRTFDKAPTSTKEHIALMLERGLIIDSIPKTAHYLKYIGYYRLSAYMLPFQRGDKTDERHQFIKNTNFQSILDAYTFDRKLRLLIMDAVERIEIAIKSIIINEMCMQ